MSNTKTVYQPINVLRDDAICANCAHFHQHHVYGGRIYRNAYIPLHVGHCAYPRIKDRAVTDTCKHFAPAESECAI